MSLTPSYLWACQDIVDKMIGSTIDPDTKDTTLSDGTVLSLEEYIDWFMDHIDKANEEDHLLTRTP